MFHGGGSAKGGTGCQNSSIERAEGTGIVLRKFGRSNLLGRELALTTEIATRVKRGISFLFRGGVSPERSPPLQGNSYGKDGFKRWKKEATSVRLNAGKMLG